jgi:L-amino acid N-acyltransferase YncA
MNLTIETMKPSDWETVEAIYREGIATGNATFEITTPDYATWDSKHRPDCRLVAQLDKVVVGWAAVSQVSARPAYAGVCEESIYIASSARGQGVGKILLTALIDASEASGIWMLQSAIFVENIASLALHKSCGFREVGYRERIGKLNGVWRTTVFIERRSQIVGLD